MVSVWTAGGSPDTYGGNHLRWEWTCFRQVWGCFGKYLPNERVAGWWPRRELDLTTHGLGSSPGNYIVSHTRLHRNHRGVAPALPDSPGDAIRSPSGGHLRAVLEGVAERRYRKTHQET